MDSRKMKPGASPPWRPPGPRTSASSQRGLCPPPPGRPPPHASNGRRGEGRSAVRAREEAGAGDTGRGAGRREAAAVVGAAGRNAAAVAEHGAQEAREDRETDGTGRKRWSALPEQPVPKRRAVPVREVNRPPPDWCKDIAVPLGRNHDAGSSRPRVTFPEGGSGAPEEAPRPPLADSKQGVRLGEALPRAAGTSLLDKVPAAGDVRLIAGGGRHGGDTRVVKSPEALSQSIVAATDGLPDTGSQRATGYTVKNRGRGAGTDESQRKEMVPSMRLPPKPPAVSAERSYAPGSRSNAGSLLGRGSGETRLPFKAVPADGGSGVSKGVVATDAGNSVANWCVAETVVSSSDVMETAANRHPRYGAVQDEELEEGKTARRVHPVEASIRHSYNEKTRDNRLLSEEKSPSRVLNKSGAGSSSVVAKSSAQGRPKEHVKGKRVSEIGRMDRVCSDVPTRISSQTTMMRNKIVLAPGPKKKGTDKSPEHPPIKVVCALGSKKKLDSKVAFNLKDDDILNAAAFFEGELKLYIRNSSDYPSLRRQIQHGVQNADDRNKFKMICRRFDFICKVLVQAVEQHLLNLHGGRIDMIAHRAMKKLPDFFKPSPIVGEVPGVEVGDEFLYRVQLATVGLHRKCRGGIDWTKDPNGTPIAISIVCSGGYPDEISSSGELIYTGSGGKLAGKKHDEDQQLKGGNLALENCISTESPVRVIYSFKSQNIEGKAKKISMYTYDGLYRVVGSCEEGEKGSMMFKYTLKKISGQPELPLHIAKRMWQSKMHGRGLVRVDISEGAEGTPICVINTVDNVRPAPFTYITTIESALRPTKVHPQGCGCTNGCSDSNSCSCARKNGGKFPFNFNGAIVSESPLIFECGPSCKCPPSCHNRVGQHGIKKPLEVFRTSKTGWGVRSLRSISSGSFVCEYVGELRHSMEADRRKNSNYLFNIGHSKGLQPGVSGLKSSGSCSGTMDDVGFTIDATECGNVARFIKHSCSPNLFAQHVLFDHGDKRMPHIMLFAAETIPPLQELTCDYK